MYDVIARTARISMYAPESQHLFRALHNSVGKLLTELHLTAALTIQSWGSVMHACHPKLCRPAHF